MALEGDGIAVLRGVGRRRGKVVVGCRRGHGDGHGRGREGGRGRGRRHRRALRLRLGRIRADHGGHDGGSEVPSLHVLVNACLLLQRQLVDDPRHSFHQDQLVPMPSRSRRRSATTNMSLRAQRGGGGLSAHRVSRDWRVPSRETGNDAAKGDGDGWE